MKFSSLELSIPAQSQARVHYRLLWHPPIMLSSLISLLSLHPDLLQKEQSIPFSQFGMSPHLSLEQLRFPEDGCEIFYAYNVQRAQAGLCQYTSLSDMADINHWGLKKKTEI
ncbi:hypothetical protein PoB_004962400 [Plakobranchus ocellatus]|uniref:Uncharacterized protein n=1 Tax=Plakobranchus ocellatus TaxID=259542 RepID=A0AAV4BSI0_9GAST|nr:hypothetical protein PoB_004962400 [Plakobranchus ocellatus]